MRARVVLRNMTSFKNNVDTKAAARNMLWASAESMDVISTIHELTSAIDGDHMTATRRRTAPTESCEGNRFPDAMGMREDAPDRAG